MGVVPLCVIVRDYSAAASISVTEPPRRER
jgi:hypothetical protein